MLLDQQWIRLFLFSNSGSICFKLKIISKCSYSYVCKAVSKILITQKKSDNYEHFAWKNPASLQSNMLLHSK